MEDWQQEFLHLFLKKRKALNPYALIPIELDGVAWLRKKDGWLAAIGQGWISYPCLKLANFVG